MIRIFDINIFKLIYYLYISENCLIGKKLDRNSNSNTQIEPLTSHSLDMKMLFGGYGKLGPIGSKQHRVLHPRTITEVPKEEIVPHPTIHPTIQPSSGDYVTFGGVWFQTNGLGTHYEITDIDGMETYYKGTLCLNETGKHVTDGMCDIDLQPGCYVFRVDGAFDANVDDISWEFCGAKGGAMTELTFCIDSNYFCKGTKIETAEEMCSDLGSDFSDTTLSVTGTFHLGGMQTEDISEEDEAAIKKALIREFSDASDSPFGKGVVELKHLSWAKANPEELKMFEASPVPSHRRLEKSKSPFADENIDFKNIFLASVSFEAKILAERYGVKDVHEAELKRLHERMSDYLSRSMSVGIFKTKLVDASRSMNSKNLQSVNFARLSHLKVVHKTAINSEMSIMSSMIVIGSAIIGIAFSYQTYHAIRVKSVDGTDSILSESQHEFIKHQEISDHNNDNIVTLK
jgi:hypothetical protein